MHPGSITINHITDADLEMVLRLKIKHENSFTFNPQTLQPGSLPAEIGNPRQPLKPVYNNLILGWGNENGMFAVIEILHRLHPDAPKPPFD
jgi:hypothetical protein